MGIIHERRKQQKYRVRVYAPPAVPVSPPVISRTPPTPTPQQAPPRPQKLKPPKKKIKRRELYIVGYPRSGTVWLSRLLGDALNCPVGSMHGTFKAGAAAEGFNRSGPYLVKQGHSMPGLLRNLGVDAKDVVYILRDPRDIIVSAHHYFKSKSTVMNFITQVMKGQYPTAFGGGMGNFIQGWLSSEMFAYQTSYEALSSNPGNELRKVLDALDVVAANDIDKVVDRQSFGQRKIVAQNKGDSMPYGKQYQIRFLRKGIVGDWRNVFSRRVGAHFDNLFGDVLVELGYAKDRNWWVGLPE